MRKLGVYSATTVGAVAVSVAFLSTGLATGTANADDYAGHSAASPEGRAALKEAKKSASKK